MIKKISLKKFIPLVVIALFLTLVYLTGVYKYLTFEMLQENRAAVLQFVKTNRVLSVFIFMLIYTISVTLSVPAGIFLSILGGFLFPQPYATVYIIISATIGATLLFLAAKTAFSDVLKQKAHKFLSKMKKGFDANATSYMLFLRLVPLFPFWAVNLAPAFLGVNVLTYIWTTAVGIIPGAFVYAQAGVGLGAIFETGADFSPQNIFNWKLRIAFIGLGFLALIPILIKKLRSYSKRKPTG